jgi:hypothetical protein
MIVSINSRAGKNQRTGNLSISILLEAEKLSALERYGLRRNHEILHRFRCRQTGGAHFDDMMWRNAVAR